MVRSCEATLRLLRQPFDTLCAVLAACRRIFKTSSGHITTAATVPAKAPAAKWLPEPPLPQGMAVERGD